MKPQTSTIKAGRPADQVDSGHAARMRESFHALLRDFVQGMDSAAANDILNRQVCRIDDVVVEFKLREGWDQVGIYADIGKPEQWQEAEVCKQLLALQLDHGTPALWVVGRHPESGHAVFSTCFPVGGAGADVVAWFRRQVDIAVQAAKAFRQQLLRHNN